MKFGIITHYDVHNHGAILQMNALKKVLEQRFNIAADILQYTKNYDFMGCDKKYKYEFSIKSIKQYIYYLRSRGVRLFLFNVKKKIIFERFKKDEKLTGDFYSKSKTLDGIVIVDEENLLSRLVKFNSDNGEIIRTSPVAVIRNRTIFEVGSEGSEQFISVAGDNAGNGTIKLVLMDQDNMEITRESNETLSEDSVLVILLMALSFE